MHYSYFFHVSTSDYLQKISTISTGNIALRHAANVNIHFSEPSCPELSEKAQVSESGFVDGNKVFTVTCLKPKHYVLLGDKEVTCQSTGWITATGALPECRRCGESKFGNGF